MSLQSIWSLDALVTVIFLPGLLFLTSLLVCARYFSSLRHVPGPIWAKVSPLYLYAICYLGIEGRVLRNYHEKLNTKVLQIAPNRVSISDPDAIHEIYVRGGGFPKDKRYTNFNLGPVASIFSATDIGYRNLRAKAVAPLFAPSRLRAATAEGGAIQTLVTKFVQQLGRFKEDIGRADILDLCARLSIDVVTAYLLGDCYGGLDEHVHLSGSDRSNAKLSANPFIFSIVALSRFSLLPHAIFRRLHAVSIWMSSNQDAAESFAHLNRFIGLAMSKTIAAIKERDEAVIEGQSKGPAGTVSTQTYQGRLLDEGISEAEAAVQSTAVVFAGADSTAFMLTTIIFHLVQSPESYRHLKEEVFDAAKTSTGGGAPDPQTLPYLRAVVKEGLRLGRANPTPLTREVPDPGLTIGGIYIPGGTVVGCAASTLHLDPDVFPEPFQFRPERWLEAKADVGSQPGLQNLSSGSLAAMEKSLMPFGAGLRACIGKNLAQQQLHHTVFAIAESTVLDGARTCQSEIQLREWFNAEMEGHHLDIEW
ncbi:cytochrome P450 [Astrocystis sublimbata]|nr:cytochrome P450 [Astrocystis sublimbata]